MVHLRKKKRKILAGTRSSESSSLFPEPGSTWKVILFKHVMGEDKV
jgi:hypothetical protein